jgi:hypothetical protein
MCRIFLSTALLIITLGIGCQATAQTEATSTGIERQADMAPMELLNSMFLDMDASAEAKTPVERDANTFAAGQRIAIYTKFANVGRTNPGAVEALMDLVADIQVFDASGMLIIDQRIPKSEVESVPYTYEGALPDAYFDSFKLTLFALPNPGSYRIALTFTDLTRKLEQTQPITVELTALIN